MKKWLDINKVWKHKFIKIIKIELHDKILLLNINKVLNFIKLWKI